MDALGPKVVPQPEGKARSPASGPAAGRIRLVAIDLDGTLLTSHKQVSEQTVGALKCLPPDVRVIIASARPPP